MASKGPTNEDPSRHGGRGGVWTNHYVQSEPDPLGSHTYVEYTHLSFVSLPGL